MYSAEATSRGTSGNISGSLRRYLGSGRSSSSSTPLNPPKRCPRLPPFLIRRPPRLLRLFPKALTSVAGGRPFRAGPALAFNFLLFNPPGSGESARLEGRLFIVLPLCGAHPSGPAHSRITVATSSPGLWHRTYRPRGRF